MFIFKVDSTRESAQKIEEFNDILNVVCNKNNSKSLTHYGTPSTFQDFSAGVRGILILVIFSNINGTHLLYG